MSQGIHRTTKEFRESIDTATADPLEWVIYHKRFVPADVLAERPEYRVIDGDNVRPATVEERQQIDAEQAERDAEAAAAALAERRRRAKEFLGSLDDSTAILVRAVLAYLVKRENETRTQPAKVFPALTAAAVKQGLLAEIDALLANGS
jgi:hypothetical protein